MFQKKTNSASSGTKSQEVNFSMEKILWQTPHIIWWLCGLMVHVCCRFKFFIFFRTWRPHCRGLKATEKRGRRCANLCLLKGSSCAFLFWFNWIGSRPTGIRPFHEYFLHLVGNFFGVIHRRRRMKLFNLSDSKALWLFWNYSYLPPTGFSKRTNIFYVENIIRTHPGFRFGWYFKEGL